MFHLIGRNSPSARAKPARDHDHPLIMVVTIDDAACRAIRSIFLTHHGIHTAIVLRAHPRGFAIPTN